MPYGLKVKNRRYKYPLYDRSEVLSIENIKYINSPFNTIKPILRPLSDLTKEIEETKFVPVDYFEIGEEINADFPFEFDHGNVKLIQYLESISKYNLHNDINYLPFSVVQKLMEWHFDVYGLIEKGLAIDINSL